MTDRLPPRAREQDALEVALTLVGDVRYLSPASLRRTLDSLSRDRLEAAAVALAAMVDEDKTPEELLAWLPGEQEVFRMVAEEGKDGCSPYLWGGSVGSRAEHGTRSRYNAGCRGAACVAAQAAYDAQPHRREARKKREQERKRSG